MLSMFQSGFLPVANCLVHGSSIARMRIQFWKYRKFWIASLFRVWKTTKYHIKGTTEICDDFVYMSREKIKANPSKPRYLNVLLNFLLNNKTQT